ncbi:MAG TPA: DUF3300 domain-containing protein [Steroidobacteraceae bacterium]|nr:DUF3300 domain-containing protein [Steroidobacteraceae bacterium]
MVKFKRLARHRRLGAALLSAALLLAAAPSDLLAQTPAADQSQPASSYTAQSPEQLQQLVAPIALYPDSLVAAILPAATFPEQIVEADRWLKGNQGLAADDLARVVNQQPWDASVKALTAFPAVLGNMDQNLSWTSSLGEAYYNQPQDVMAAVQVLRRSAEAAGTLQGTPEEDVTTQGSDVDIEPTDPDVVYVPEYDPWAVYGIAIDAWPGWYDYPGIWYAGPFLSFGIGSPIGFFRGYPWGWHHWRCDWRGHNVLFDRAHYASRSFSFVNRGNFYRGPAAHGEFHLGTAGRFSAPPDRYSGNFRAARGYPVPHSMGGMRSGGFSRYARGGEPGAFAPRGHASFGGGGFRAGGSFRGGGGFRGGGRSGGHSGGRSR